MGRWAPRRPAAYFTAAGQRAAVRNHERARRRGESLPLLLFLRGGDGAIAGKVSLSGIVRGALHGAILGYSLAEPHRGKGLMHEAVRAVLAHAFGPMGLHRISAGYMPANRASGRVLRRLGFRREGIARDFLLIDGRWEDHVLTALVNPRWVPGNDPVAIAAAGGRSRRRRPGPS